MRVDIDLNRSKPQHPRSTGGPRAAQNGIDARDDLMRVEWFDDVVVGAKPQAGKAVDIFRQRRHHDHWRGRILADARQNLEAIDAWDANVEQYQIGRQHCVMGKRDITIGGCHRAKTFPCQIGFENFGDARFVLDDKDEPLVHAPAPWWFQKGVIQQRITAGNRKARALRASPTSVGTLSAVS